MRWGRAIAGGFIAELLLVVAIMPGFALGSEPIVIWTAVIGAPVATFLAALWVGQAPRVALRSARRSGRPGRDVDLPCARDPERPDAAADLLARARTEDSGRRRRRHVRGAAHGQRQQRRARRAYETRGRHRHSLAHRVACRQRTGAGRGTTTPASSPAQGFRATLTGPRVHPERPSVPAIPRPRFNRPLSFVPVWWPWGVVMLPETIDPRSRARRTRTRRPAASSSTSCRGARRSSWTARSPGTSKSSAATTTTSSSPPDRTSCPS